MYQIQQVGKFKEPHAVWVHTTKRVEQKDYNSSNDFNRNNNNNFKKSSVFLLQQYYRKNIKECWFVWIDDD